MSRSAENRLLQASWARKPSAMSHAPLDPSVLKGEVPQGAIPLSTTSDRFNMNPMVVQNILESSYMKKLVAYTYQDLIDEIYNHVEHVGPWSAGTSRNPSTAWCVLYRMLCMRLTRNQMRAMLKHQDSVYIRAIGFLYLRLATDAKELWDWFSPHLKDPTEIAPGPDGATMPLGKYLRMLLTEMKYYGTMLPRIPVITARELKVKIALMDQAAVRARENAAKAHLFRKGTAVRAIFSEDDQWYDATLGEEVSDGVFEVVYDNYGNAEHRSLGYIELKDDPTRGSRDSGRGSSRDRDGRGRDSYADLAKRVLERERSGALASGKDYAQRPASYKGSLSLRMDTYTSRRSSRSRSPVRRRSTDRSDAGGGRRRDRGRDDRDSRDYRRDRRDSRDDRRSRDRRDSRDDRRSRDRHRDSRDNRRSRDRHRDSRDDRRSRDRHRSSRSRSRSQGRRSRRSPGRGGGSGSSAALDKLREKYGDAAAGSKRRD